MNPTPAQEPEGSSEREREEVAEGEELPIVKDGGLIRVEGTDYRLEIDSDGDVTYRHVYFPADEKVSLGTGARFRVEGCEETLIAGCPPQVDHSRE